MNGKKQVTGETGYYETDKTEDAVGHVLCHDITQIIRGVTKDAVFRKGHIVTARRTFRYCFP